VTNLLGTSYKLDKSNAVGAALSEPILNAVMYLAPSDSGGLGNLCPWATAGCRVVCLGIGSGRMNHGAAALASREFDWEKTTVSKAMIWRTKMFMKRRPAFKAKLDAEVGALRAKARRQGMKTAVRLNGTTDIVWEKVYPELFAKYHDVIFYDYTKAPRSVRASAPANYHLTFSYAETAANHLNALDWLKAGKNIAVVFDTTKGEALPESFLSYKLSRAIPVIDADSDDMRFLDPVGVVAGLRAKGAAKHDKSGFVVAVENINGAMVGIAQP